MGRWLEWGSAARVALLLLGVFFMVGGAGRGWSQDVLPAPLVEITGQEDVVGPPAYRKYSFRISNALAYPEEIFALAPDLPPCGMIATASRTWVDVYTTTDGQNRLVQNYCELAGHGDLEGLSFVAQLTDLPEAVFVELNDRREAKVYRSAAVALSGGGLPPVASVVWQRQYFVEEAELLADADGDGYATWAEGQFGTDPRSSDSAPVVRVVSYGVGGAQVFWNSVAGARVQPETTTTLGSWQPLGDPLTGNGLAIGIPLPEAASLQFIRLRALPLLDEDGDGLNSLDEGLLGTAPALIDTDGDTFSDSDEFARRWNPLVPEFHPFWREKYGVAWSEVETDVDGDGLTARQESSFGTDPADATSKPDLTVVPGQTAGTQVLRWTGVMGIRYQLERAEQDGGWVPWGVPSEGAGRVIEFTVPNAAEGPSALWRLTALSPLDDDGDRLDGYAEGLTGTDPAHADTDGDGATDGQEVLVLKTNPLRGVQAPTLATLPGAVATPTLAVAGQAEAGEMVTVSGGALPVSVMAGDSGAFSAMVTLNPNRLNRLSASSRNAAGQTGPVRTVEVIHDLQPPVVHIDFPGNNAEVSTETATIAGRVADSLSGYQGLSVTVNGQPANVMVGIGTNGTYERPAIPLNVGENPITVVARDAHGNTSTQSIMLFRSDPAGARLVVAGGSGQTGIVHRRMPTPIEVEARDASGRPWPGKVVKFMVIRSDGRLAPSASHPTAGELVFQAITDVNGRARAWWVLGSDAGCGNNRLEVTSDGISGAAFVCASANPGPASQINIGSGNTQTGEVNGFVREPLRVWVSDACNGIQGVNVTFRVTRGGGKVNGSEVVTVPTTRTGHAQVDFQIGPDPGNHVIEATYPGFTGSPAVFTLRGLVRTPEQATSFTAIAQDNAGQPIGGATAFIKASGQLVGPVTSTPDGVIAFTSLPAAGSAELLVDAKPATSLGGQSVPAGSFPALNFQMTLVANAANEHPGPVLFPKLNPANAVKYDGTHDVMLECQGIEGLQFIVRAGSMTRANGTKPSGANPEFLSLNQVAHDDVPMPMPDGASPPFAWTFQPAGATFNPPVEIRYPNMSGLTPGSIAYFLSYDHAVEKFDIVSSGHVTPDGAHIVTDAGSGLTLSGWGCNCPPYSVTGDCEPCLTTCVEPGTITDGEVDAKPSVVCPGVPITFEAKGPSDENGAKHIGGKIKITCKDGDRTVDAPPALLQYTWKVTLPDGSVSEGKGQQAQVTPTTPGEITCEFRVSVDPKGQGEGSCKPAPRNLMPKKALAAHAQVTQIASLQLGDGQRSNFLPEGSGQGDYGLKGPPYIVVGARADGLVHLYAALRYETIKDIKLLAGVRRVKALVMAPGGAMHDMLEDPETLMEVTGVVEGINLKVDPSSWDPNRVGEIVLGYDVNGNSKLDADELCVSPRPLYFTMVSSWDYFYAVDVGVRGSLFTLLGYASSFLRAFLQYQPPFTLFGDSPIVGEVSDFSVTDPDLEHRIGIPFFGMSGAIPIYRYPAGHDLGNKIMASSRMTQIIKDAIRTRIKIGLLDVSGELSEVRKAILTLPPQPIDYGDSLDVDLHLAFGKAKLSELQVDLTYSPLPPPHVITVLEAKVSGFHNDLYDWNYSYSFLDHQMAIIQAGFPTLGGGGRIFRTQVVFEQTPAPSVYGVLKRDP